MKNTPWVKADCIRAMFPCFVFYFLHELLSLIIPSLSADLIGSMADQLLQNDLASIKTDLFKLLWFFLTNVILLQIIRILKNVILTKRGYAYARFLINRFLVLPFPCMQKLSESDLIQRINDDSTDYYFTLMEKYTHPFICIIYLGVLIIFFCNNTYHILFVLTILLISLVPMIRYLFVRKVKTVMKKKEKEFQEQRRKMEFDMFSSREYILYSGCKTAYLQKMDQCFGNMRKDFGQKKDAIEVMDALMSYYQTYFAPLLVLLIGAMMIFSTAISKGAVLAGYLLLPSINRLSEYFQTFLLALSREKMLENRISDLYSDQQLEKDCSGSENPLNFPVQLTKVTCRYPDADMDAFKPITLCIPAGSLIHVKGPNGSGKTTLLKAIAGLMPYQGIIYDDRRRIMSEDQLINSSAYIGQEDFLFSGTVEENLFVSNLQERKEALVYLKKMRMPFRLEDMVDEEGNNLSLGERKKLCIIRGLLKKASLILIDEPFNHLDTESSESFMEILMECPEAIVMVSHQNIDMIKEKNRYIEVHI